MDFEIVPGQPEHFREALTAVLEGLLDPPGQPSEWWRAGVRENVDPDDAA